MQENFKIEQTLFVVLFASEKKIITTKDKGIDRLV